MKTALIVASALALVLLLVLPLLHALGLASVEANRYGMTLGTIGWFATAPFWMRYRSD